MIELLTSKAGIYIGTFVSFVLGLAAFWFKAKSKGREDAFRESADAAAKLMRKVENDRNTKRAAWDIKLEELNRKFPPAPPSE